MVERAEAEDVRLIVDHMHRYNRGYETIGGWEEEYELGDPVQFISRGGAVGLINNGVHLLDLAINLFDSHPIEVTSTARSQAINPRSDDLEFYGGTAVWTFEEDREVVLAFSNRCSITWETEIYYRDGQISIEKSPEYTVTVRHRDPAELSEDPSVTRHGPAVKELHTMSERFTEDYLRVLERAQTDLLSDDAPTSPGRVGRDVTEALIASLIARAESRHVSIPVSRDSQYWDHGWQYN